MSAYRTAKKRPLQARLPRVLEELSLWLVRLQVEIKMLSQLIPLDSVLILFDINLCQRYRFGPRDRSRLRRYGIRPARSGPH